MKEKLTADKMLVSQGIQFLWKKGEKRGQSPFPAITGRLKN